MCSLSSSSVAYYWYDEVQKLKSEGDTAIYNCKINNNLLFRKDNTKACAYGRNACEDLKDNGYSELLCPLNYNFIIDEPKGTRNNIINSILQFNSRPEDIFNSMYFIKKDLRKPVFLYSEQNISKIQDIYPVINLDSNDKPNDNKLINVKSGDLIKISKSSEVDLDGKRYNSYYLYAIYDLIVTLPTSINMGLKNVDNNSGTPIIINSLLDFKTACAKMERSFQISLDDEKLIQEDNSLSCDNVPRDIRQPKNFANSKKSNKYSTLCFFYEKSDIGSLCDLLQDILIKYINKSILEEYLSELKTKITKNITITIFEYIIYIILVNYLRENSNYKFVVNIIK